HCFPLPAVVASYRDHFVRQSTYGARPQGKRSFPAAGFRATPETYRHHHGRQWALGQTAPHAARGRTPCRSNGRALDRRDRGAHSCPCPYALRVFGGELEEAPAGRSRLSDGTAEPLSEGGSSHAEQEQYSFGIYRAAARIARGRAGTDGMGAPGDGEQQWHGA